MTEEWRPIAKLPGYEVSSLGRIRLAVERPPNSKGSRYPFHKGKIFKTYAVRLSSGYLWVSFKPRIDGKLKAFGVAQLVCEAFHGPRPTPEHGALHKDGNSLRCVVGNLYWGTMKDNMVDRARHGRTARGEHAGSAKLTDKAVREIRASLLSQRALGRLYGVAPTTIRNAKNRTNWRHLP